MKPPHPRQKHRSLVEFTQSIVVVQKSTGKTVKVMEDKGRLRDCHGMEGTEGTC